MQLEQLSVEQFKGLTNVVVTLSPAETKDVQLIGLFGGVMPITKTDTTLVSKEDVYFCVIKGTVIHFLSSLFYEVKQIDVGGLKENGPEAAPVTIITSFDSKKQADALIILKKIHAAMREEKRVTEFDMIDDDKYSGITDSQKHQINTEGPVGNPSKSVSYSTGRSGGINYGTEDWYGNQHWHNPNACGYISGAYNYKAKTITTTTFARTKKAEQEELDAMAAKLKAIREGVYEPPTLPTIPADKVQEKKEDEKKVTTTESSQQTTAPSEDNDDAMERMGNAFFLCS